MRKFSVWLALFVVSIPSLTHAIDLRGDSTSIFRFEQRDIPGFEKQSVIPATEFLRFDITEKDLSFHAYGWGRVDLADRSTNEDSTDGDLAYAYLQYRAPKGNGLVKLGRFYVYEGVAAEQVDGAGVRVDIPGGYTASLFGGAPVRLDDNNNKGDSIVGGRISYRYPSIIELGISALYENGVRTGQTADLKNYRELVGGDVWLGLGRFAEVNGHTFYNTVTNGYAAHSYLLAIRPVRMLTISGEYQDYRFEDYFASTNLRSLFNPDSGEKFKVYGGAVTVAANRTFEVTGDFKRYERDSTGRSNRFGGEARLNLLEKKLRTGLSYHRSDGADAINSYNEVRGYGLYDAPKYFASLDGIAHFFDDPIYGKDEAFEVIGSLGWRIIPNLALSGDLSYGENPREKEELRGVVRLAFNFTTESKGAKK